MSVRKCCSIASVLVLIAATATVGHAAQAAQAGQAAKEGAQKAAQGFTSSKPVSISGTIEAIDQSNRILTVKGPKGNLEEIWVSSDVKRFSELKVGDTVKLSYYESLAVSVRKPGEPAPTSAVTEAITPGTGGRPGATLARQATITVTIVSIDPAAPSVTVKGPKGNVMSMRVQDPKRLTMVKVGDTVDVTYTQAALVEVETVKK